MIENKQLTTGHAKILVGLDNASFCGWQNN